MNHTIKSIKEYQKYFNTLIDLERNEEIAKQLHEILHWTGYERQKKGRAILGLKGYEAGRGLGGIFLVRLKTKGRLPKTDIGIGDLVILSGGKPTGKEQHATVIEKSNSSMTIAYSQVPGSYVYGKELRLDLFANDIAYTRMKEAVHYLKEGQVFSDLLLLKSQLTKEINEEVLIDFHNKQLNDSQQRAITESLFNQDVFLFHGPPGTGKTTTLAESIYQHTFSHSKLLATADSNIAVDNLVEKLLSYNIKVVRVGNPARMHHSLIECTLDKLLEEESEFQEAASIWNKIWDKKDIQKNYVVPSGQSRRGLSDTQIKKLAKKGDGFRGIPHDKIRKMAVWLKIQEEVNELVEKAKNLEALAIEKIIDKSQVVCTTNVSAGSDILKDYRFNVSFIDEATQATEPSCLIPMVKSKKWVLSGDHLQLPPTVICPEANDLNHTLFERWIKSFAEASAMLTTQYRMNKEIMCFSNQSFYENSIIAHSTVANRSLSDLSGFYFDGFNKIMDPNKPVLFVDVEGKEQKPEGAFSIFNKDECLKVVQIVDELFKSRLFPHDIGVLSPYDAQVKLLKKHLEGYEVETNSIDGFQGREKEVIIISLVRANLIQSIGFLSDQRRLNVALTRAKRKLIVIGCKNTLVNSTLFREFIKMYEYV